ncbi:Lrp/AsnC ligand binding domain-containing protein [Dactylosporangium darangshiense]|uniref:Transcription regulator AsnC/Lrp ligand binding domain-containing protein n=1 Tax=Dactylosporangium darangshiense TaxID=579108 RepID=A0ABP8DUW7_9ACTN
MTSDGDIQAVVLVRTADPDTTRLDRLLRRIRGVTAAWHLAGDADLLVLVTCRDLGDLRRILTRLRAEGRAVITDTHLVLRQAR